MNIAAVATPSMSITRPSLREAHALNLAANSVPRESSALPHHLAFILDAVDCGLLLRVGPTVIYQNRAARLAMEVDVIPLADAEQPLVDRSVDANAINDVLRRTHQTGSCRMLSLGSSDRDLTAAVIPLALCGVPERDVTLVILGKRSVCEELSANAISVLHEIEEFLIGVGRGPETDRALLTMLFTDIVGSTQRAEHLGDDGWHRLLERHHSVIRRHLADFRGREIDTAGDGFFATFDGPARAVRCARAIRNAVQAIGIEIRVGLHTGECEIVGSKVVGVAVHVAARVAAAAAAGEILVSSTVKDLVAGSGLQFTDRGAHNLKGVPGEWRLFAVQ